MEDVLQGKPIDLGVAITVRTAGIVRLKEDKGRKQEKYENLRRFQDKVNYINGLRPLDELAANMTGIGQDAQWNFFRVQANNDDDAADEDGNNNNNDGGDDDGEAGVRMQPLLHKLRDVEEVRSANPEEYEVEQSNNRRLLAAGFWHALKVVRDTDLEEVEDADNELAYPWHEAAESANELMAAVEYIDLYARHTLRHCTLRLDGSRVPKPLSRKELLAFRVEPPPKDSNDPPSQVRDGA